MNAYYLLGSKICSCARYYTPTSNLLAATSRKCENGQWSPLNQRFSCEADCGISPSDAGAFIVGGSTAKAGKVVPGTKNKSFEILICNLKLISSF